MECAHSCTHMHFLCATHMCVPTNQPSSTHTHTALYLPTPAHVHSCTARTHMCVPTNQDTHTHSQLPTTHLVERNPVAALHSKVRGQPSVANTSTLKQLLGVERGEEGGGAKITKHSAACDTTQTGQHTSVNVSSCFCNAQVAGGEDTQQTPTC